MTYYYRMNLNSSSEEDIKSNKAVRLDDIRDLATIPVEHAGRVLGMGRTASYEAVRRGDIPSIRIGSRVVVPVPALMAMLGA